MTLTFHEVTPERWPDFEKLFSARGAPSNCWCTLWRLRGAESKAGKSTRKAFMAGRIASGVPVGILGYRDGEPVAWCSIAPRETYRPLGGPEEPSAPGAVWSIACFFVPRSLRGQGTVHQLIEAAVALAKKKGAEVVEAYPVDPDAHSYRFMGFVPAFEKAGFEEVGRAGTKRHVMRRVLPRKSR